jgi:RNA polymerase sigma factor (sigma-70 family)
VPNATETLTTALAAGDENAVETFYRQYFDWLYAQARRATRRDESFCLDVVQDAVIRVLRSVKPVATEEARFRAWLKLVVQTAAWDKLRSERSRQRREQVSLELARVTVGGDDRDEVAEEDQRQWLKAQIDRLDPEIVRMIELRFEQRWTLGRIGKLLGLSIGTVDWRLRRALKELRDRAIEEFEE